ncbi:MAG: DUF805 domain-containing protein [Puniceicoccales bacterium]|nr:DUF805 domain-containing protein [Puniceicoccales bacterium]
MFTTKGRAPRSEFFFSFIFSVFLVILLLMFLGFAWSMIEGDDSKIRRRTERRQARQLANESLQNADLALPEEKILGIIFLLFLAIVMLSTLTIAAARRLHDMNGSGFFSLFLCVPGALIIFLPILFFKKGDRGANHYGPDPLAVEEPDAI